MSVNSILTNSAAANALLNFNKTQTELQDVQSRLSTGQKVGSAKDNASTFAIALGLRSDVATFKTVKENLATGSQIVDSSLSVATSISDQISTLKTKLAQAKDQPQGRALIQQDIDGALDQIKNWTKSATFNGINLLDGKGADAGQKFSVTASLDRNSSGDPTLNSLSFDYQNLSIDKADKGLGSLLGMNVVQGAATETKTAMAGGLLSATLSDSAKQTTASVDLATTGAFDVTAAQQVSFTLGSGTADAKSVTFALDPITASAIAGEAGKEADAKALTDALNTKLKELGLDKDGLSFSYDDKGTATNGTLTLTDTNARIVSGFTMVDSSAAATPGFGAPAYDAAPTDRSAFTKDDQFNLTYKDASGAQKTISMKAVTGTPASAYEFQLGTGATAQKDTLSNLQSALSKLTDKGGALEGSGLTFSKTDTTIKVERDAVNSNVQLVGISTTDSTTKLAVASAEVGSAQAKGATSQIKLAFDQNNVLKAGDEITMTVNNDGKDEKLTFRIGAADQTVKNGAKVDGADNTYYLNYRDVVGSENEQRTGSQVAELMNFVMTKGADSKINTDANPIGAEVAGLSFRVYGGIAADQTETQSNAALTVDADPAAVDVDALKSVSFTVGEGDKKLTFSLDASGIADSGDTAANAITDLKALATKLNTSLTTQYGANTNLSFVADDTGKLSLQDKEGRAISNMTITDADTTVPSGITGGADAAAHTTATNAAARFQNIAGAKGVSLSWDSAGGLTLTDTKQDNKTTLSSFNVNGNSNGLDFNAMLAKADEAEQTVKKVLGSLGSASSRLTAQSGFVDNMVKTLNNNVSTLVDADMAEEAARLQALQTKSQLGIQALSTANQSTQSILSLFR
ncbi:flagellin [Azospirillum sp. A1-3]|uniref:flagellin n=1 Tax=Azospirillum sp. A1-3 TaxID=185874 RepID=UPI0020772A6C|nr:flagellin [Azospirillum sp. A1-3]MCM8738744.1 flagellin [Azospirillum sp. A1-3]